MLCTIAMVCTLLPELLRPIFADELCTHQHFTNIDLINRVGFVDDRYHWGSRHYWYFWMMILLFCLSLVKAIIDIVMFTDKK